MYEYKFVKHEFTVTPDKLENFDEDYAEEDFFSYRKIINKKASEGWRLNTILHFTDPFTGDANPIGVELIFERKK